MDPQDATEHDYPHDDEDCNACGGSEQIEIVFQDHSRDYAACPVCLARDKNETIAAKDAEIERLRAALAPFVRAAGFHCIEVQADESLQVLVKVAPGLSGALTVKDFRQACAAYQQSSPAKEG